MNRFIMLWGSILIFPLKIYVNTRWFSAGLQFPKTGFTLGMKTNSNDCKGR
jgi:hypothetical protein